MLFPRNILTTLAATILLAFNGIQASAAPDLLNIPVVDIHGRTGALAAFPGKTFLIVNTASECGYTTQLEGLEALYQKYKDRGLLVVGFPSNDFGQQEPLNEAEIYKFCTSRFKVSFPLFSKVGIRVNAHPLFTALTSPESPIPGPVIWNFTKFLVSKDGVLKARFMPDVEPDSLNIQQAIEKELGLNKK